MARINRKNIETLLNYLRNNADCYFLIGGHAAALHFEKIGLEFRATKDYDIVLVTGLDDSSFTEEVIRFILEGEYKNKYRNNKKTAYRFEDPKSNEFPKILEFFVKEGEYPQSLDNRLAKLDIEINEEKISAIVLNEEIYEFAMKNVEIVDGLSIVSVDGLIALKSFAYFRNKELFEEGKVNKDDYLKHRRDIVRLLSITDNNNAIANLPELLKQTAKDFLPVLENANDVAKEYSINVKTIVEIYKKKFSL